MSFIDCILWNVILKVLTLPIFIQTVFSGNCALKSYDEIKAVCIMSYHLNEP